MGNTLDKLGMISALICAVHCLAIPVILMSGASFFGFIDHWIIDVCFITMGLGFIYLSIFRSYKKHGNKGPIYLSIVGLCFFIMPVFYNHESLHFLFGIGGLMWASAHFYNHRIVASSKNITT